MLQPQFNRYPKPTDWNSLLLLAQQAFEIGFRAPTFQELVAKVSELVSILGGAGIVPTSEPNTTLPEPAQSGKIMIMRPGSYTQPGGGTLVAPDNSFNVGYWDGEEWSVSVSIETEVNLNDYTETVVFNPVKAAVDSTTSFDNLYVIDDFVEGYRYDNVTGNLVSDPQYGALLLQTDPGKFYTAYGNGIYLNYVRFDENGNFTTAGGIVTPNLDGSFTLASSMAGTPTHALGITLMNDGGFHRKNSIIIQEGSQINLAHQLIFDRIDRKNEILLKNAVFQQSSNLINKNLIVFGAQATSSGIISSDQMYIELRPAPPAGTHAISGVVNLSVFRETGGVFTNNQRTIVGDYFTTEVPEGVDALYLNLAATSADWWRADTVMMNAGSVPDPYQPYGDRINPDLLPEPEQPSSIHVVHESQVPDNPEKGTTIYNKDRYMGFVFDDVWRPLAGGLKYVGVAGKIYEWLFDGGSLVSDGVSKSSGLSITSESYSSTGYSFDAPTQTNLYEFLRFDNAGIHLFEFQKEIMEVEVTRVGAGFIGILYIGETISRKVHAMAGITNSGIFLRDAVNIPATSYTLNLTQNRTIEAGQKYRIVHEFFGAGRRVRVYNITSGDELVGDLGTVWPVTPSGGYSTRPNNRSLGIIINNFGAKITKYELHKNESDFAELIVMGDSISVARVATSYDKGWSKLATQYIGAGSYVHGGGSNTAEDLLNSLQDTLDMKPKKVVLAIGTNDCNLNKPNRYAEHQSLVSQLEAAGAEVIISNVIPAYSQSANPANWTRILDYNAWLQTTYGATHTIVDQFSILVNGSGNDWNLSYKGDDLHPNDAGHQRMFENLKSVL